MIDTITFENDAGKIFRLSDYGLILKSFDAPEPAPKTYIETVEGADGDLDMTEWTGVVRYQNRDVEIGVRDMSGYWWRELANFCHGRRMRITHSNDPDHYYYGRCVVSHETEQRVTDMVIAASCNPYRLCHRETVVSASVSGSATILLEARRRPVTPTVTVSAQMTIEYDGNTVALPAGTYPLMDLVITDSHVPVSVTGTGTISFAWQDGDL